MKVYKIKGTTDAVTECGLCGRIELKGTVVLAALDADGNEFGEVSYFGTSCAAKGAGWTVRQVNDGIKAAKDEARETVRQERDADAARYREFAANWYLKHYGTADAHEAAKLAGMSAARLSDGPFQAYRELKYTEETATAVADETPQPVAVEIPVPCQPAQPEKIHFMTLHCVDCNAFRLASMNRETVEQWYRTGHFSQDEYEAYMFVWATSAVRHSAGGWAEEPTDPNVITVVAAIRRHAGIVTPVALAA
ncbi:hypothetical protein [Streptomyces sp. or20]|uniref:hypothetical protein n=1 Tax=Streptomyces sp. or20 TaxID=1828016 RepID=UPI000BF24A3A|nr:hypothetical protein [Streptomyces sp. or20]